MDEFMLGLILGAAGMGLIVFLIIMPVKDDSWRTQIEAHGCGGYYLDSNRIRQWNWKP